ncbi:MAG: 1-(5-phosphoribosyl)-5-amino-4-imidazole-carboxylate carboxylase [Mesoaciditoga sp.]|uniref:nickel pincer cofactor biosynthesis protein LarB n=1 Tax=Athalassotoga sp. TaxID=2022597 RepID=UPI000CB04E67|nr:MAG: 1-(5-phosphoribosyl)-5-amino-4-imidazole-carboxylate carboxylase [Mesoaciditoga sp.]PMP79978.1 MAG: 1-(5-phosphoribosyl)-5-amino-4-imidazole-carboxylate carboxylase [Mesoaciditoga sp.]HEU24219.1 nickel pincer cofactor biosynthesis protein LarB [Mesoaciditoga lauensis]
MIGKDLKNVLENLKSGKISVEKAIEIILDPGYDDIDFARVDVDRSKRRDFPEVIFCEGKSDEQVVKIFEKLGKYSPNLLGTRANRSTFEMVKEIFPQAQYNPIGKTITIEREKPAEKGSIMVISAGTSDLPVLEECFETARIMGNKVSRLVDVGVAGIHRILYNVDLLDSARVIIVIAGMDGALPSVVAGLVKKPVIAVPTSVGYGANFNGLAPLLTMLNNCSGGIGVVNIDNGFGAAYLANLINKIGEE